MNCIANRERRIVENYFNRYDCDEKRIRELQELIKIAVSQCSCYKCNMKLLKWR